MHITFFLTVFIHAISVKIQGMICDLKIIKTLNHLLNNMNSRITKFHYPVAVSADQVIVLFKTVRFFIKSQIFPKLAPFD